MLSLLQECKQQGARNRELIMQRKEAIHHAIQELRSKEAAIAKLTVEAEEIDARSAHTAGLADVLDHLICGEQSRERRLAEETEQLRLELQEELSSLEKLASHESDRAESLAQQFRPMRASFRNGYISHSTNISRLALSLSVLENEGRACDEEPQQCDHEVDALIASLPPSETT